jgi:hypothetical protein
LLFGSIDDRPNLCKVEESFRRSADVWGAGAMIVEAICFCAVVFGELTDALRSSGRVHVSSRNRISSLAQPPSGPRSRSFSRARRRSAPGVRRQKLSGMKASGATGRSPAEPWPRGAEGSVERYRREEAPRNREFSCRRFNPMKKRRRHATIGAANAKVRSKAIAPALSSEKWGLPY